MVVSFLLFEPSICRIRSPRLGPTLWQCATWSGLSHTSWGDDRWVWSNGGMMLTVGKRRTRRKTWPSATLSNTNPKCTQTGVNPDLGGERQATNFLNHNRAQEQKYAKSIIRVQWTNYTIRKRKIFTNIMTHFWTLRPSTYLYNYPPTYWSTHISRIIYISDCIHVSNQFAYSAHLYRLSMCQWPMYPMNHHRMDHFLTFLFSQKLSA
jgi:hypothetical protein